MSKVDIECRADRRLGPQPHVNPGAWSGTRGWSKARDAALINVRNPADGALLAQVRPRHASPTTRRS